MSAAINLTASKEDAELIRRIVERADNRFEVEDKLSMTMDLTACHLNGCPLDLEKLVAADDATLIHDVWGITAYLDRTTGRLTKQFLPRCAKREGGAV